uniref:Uncharacterized protein n=1 Tax=Timema douglasi TaxID=61478 RepID=A0A7R8VLE7_TIMDO|nr:unnamed protein product [Timema douglasi]
MCTVIFYFHMYHVSTIFENDRNFSHLSTLEREMSFRSEMGLYYSYYKTLVEAKTFYEGLVLLTTDNSTEYPTVINVIGRFNVYPEIIVALVYRIFVEYIGLSSKVCWQIEREALPPVISCVGLGDQMYFYINAIWLASGLTMIVVFLYGTFLSRSDVGGTLAVICFFYNHAECTRVQWAPPLRESFAYPFLLLEIFHLSFFLRNRVQVMSPWSTRLNMFAIILNTTLVLIMWQFSQFILASQLLVLNLMEAMNLIKRSTFLTVIVGQSIGVTFSALLLFGNKFLLSSLLVCTLFAVVLTVSVLERLMPLKGFVKTVLSRFLFLGVGILVTKKLLGFMIVNEDDSHIINILYSKFTAYKDFHTLMYTCAAEFDFLPREMISNIVKTLLLPSAFAAILAFATYSLHSWTFSSSDISTVESDVVYSILQLGPFIVMSALVMRLKLFLTPQLCILTSLLAARRLNLEEVNPRLQRGRVEKHFKKTTPVHPTEIRASISPFSAVYFNTTSALANYATEAFFSFLRSRELHWAGLVLLVCCMSPRGLYNLRRQWGIMGEASNPPMEEMLLWVQASTSSTSVFGGPMSVMANLKLSTGRAIVNHPHYEDQGSREKTKRVYTAFSRKTPREVFQTLVRLQVNYLVLEERWCFSGSREGCFMVDLWDVEDPENSKNPAVCPQLFYDPPPPFRKVFHNRVYVILHLPSDNATRTKNYRRNI